MSLPRHCLPARSQPSSQSDYFYPLLCWSFLSFWCVQEVSVFLQRHPSPIRRRFLFINMEFPWFSHSSYSWYMIIMLYTMWQLNISFQRVYFWYIFFFFFLFLFHSLPTLGPLHLQCLVSGTASTSLFKGLAYFWYIFYMFLSLRL